MEIIRGGSQAPAKGPDGYFTGNVAIEWQFSRTEPARLAVALGPADARGYDQRLAERMTVPGGARPGLKTYQGACEPCRRSA